MNIDWHETSPVTDQFGLGLAHQVLDAARPYHTARLPTVCGEYIIPAPMIGPVGEPCPACTAIVAGCCASPDARKKPMGLRRLLPHQLAHRCLCRHTDCSRCVKAEIGV